MAASLVPRRFRVRERHQDRALAGAGPVGTAARVARRRLNLSEASPDWTSFASGSGASRMALIGGLLPTPISDHSLEAPFAFDGSPPQPRAVPEADSHHAVPSAHLRVVKALNVFGPSLFEFIVEFLEIFKSSGDFPVSI
jgi:hypothetical protein